MEVFNSGSLYFQIKEPYLSNNDFNNKEISDFIDEHYNGGKWKGYFKDRKMIIPSGDKYGFW